MARQAQLPDGSFVIENGTRQAQLPSGSFMSETVATTTTYSKGRLVQHGASPGGAAQSRGRIVNSGGV